MGTLRAMRPPRRAAADPDARFDWRQLRRLWSVTRPLPHAAVAGRGGDRRRRAPGVAFPVIVGDLFNTAFGVQGDADIGGILRGAPEPGDGVARRPRPADLNRIGLVLAAVFVVQALFNFVRVYQLGYVGEAVVADLRKQLFGHLWGCRSASSSAARPARSPRA
jgi:ABC-type multidrug transport system fused ATPase/permease subunit